MAITMTWNVAADKKFESGLDRGVLYIPTAGVYSAGYAWEGLINVTEKPGGAELTDLWANNAKYAQLQAVETFACSIECYTYPDEFMACLGVTEDGTDPGVTFHGQARSKFGLAWRTYIGSDQGGQTEHYKLHLVYGLLAKPSEMAHQSINDSPEAATFTFEAESTPVAGTGLEPVSKITLLESVLTATNLTSIEEELYGSDQPTTANLPLPDALVALLV